MPSWPDSARECDVRTLAQYRREKPAKHASPASLIAANAHFTCYAIRNGLIRAIHRESEATTLLRGLTTDIADIRFCETEDIVAAVAADGSVYAWHLSVADKAVVGRVVLCFLPEAAQSANASSAAKLNGLLSFVTGAAGAAQPALCFVSRREGTADRLVAMRIGDADPSSAPKAELDVAGLPSVSAIASSPAAGRLLVGGSGGEARLVGLQFAEADGSDTWGAPGPVVAAHAGEPVVVASALGTDGFVTAGARGGDIKVWRATTSDGPLVPVGAVSLGAPPPSLHDPTSLPPLQVVDRASGRLLIGLSSSPTTHQIASLQLALGADGTVAAGPPTLIACEAVTSLLSMCCCGAGGGAGSSSGGLDVFILGATAVQAITLREGSHLASAAAGGGGGEGVAGGGSAEGGGGGPPMDALLRGLSQQLLSSTTGTPPGPPPGPPRAMPPPPRTLLGWRLADAAASVERDGAARHAAAGAAVARRRGVSCRARRRRRSSCRRSRRRSRHSRRSRSNRGRRSLRPAAPPPAARRPRRLRRRRRHPPPRRATAAPCRVRRSLRSSNASRISRRRRRRCMRRPPPG